MIRLTIIFLVLMILITIVVGQETDSAPTNNALPEIIVPTETTAELPADFLPADFIEEVTADNPLPALPAQNTTNTPTTFSVDDLPRTSGLPQNTTIQTRNTLPESESTETVQNTGAAETTVLPGASTPAFIPSNAITQETLTFADTNPSDYGLLDETNGGFAGSIWQGLDATAARNLIQPLVTRDASVTYLDSWTHKNLSQILLTRATAPQDATTTSWLAFRAQQLLNMGQSAAAFNLVRDVTPEQRASDSELLQIWTMAQLMAGQAGTVCPSVMNQVRNNNTAFWKQALLLCQLKQNERQKLGLSLNVATVDDKAAAPEFYAALQAAQVGDVVVLGEASQTVTVADPMLAALIAEPVRTQPAREFIITPFTSTLQRWRDDVRANVASRLHAAEQLALKAPNAPNIATLRALYTTVQFSAQDVTAPIETAEAQPHPSLGRALLFQATQNAPLPALKASTQAALFTSLAEDNLTALSTAFLPPRTLLAPMPELAWLAPQIIQFALKAGQTDLARDWFTALQQNDNLSPDLIAQRHSLGLAVAVAQNANITQEIATWLNNTESGHVQSILASLDALGLSIPAEVWRQAATDTTNQAEFQTATIGPLWLRMVADGLQNNRTGEVLLLLMQPLQNQDITNIPPLTLANVITGLKYIKEDGLALELVLELLL